MFYNAVAVPTNAFHKILRLNALVAKLLATSLIIPVFLSMVACGVASIKYHMDPDLSGLSQLSSTGSSVYLKVIDSRSATPKLPADYDEVGGPTKETEVLRQKLLTQLKKSGFKIISKPLLADLTIEVEVITLNLAKKPSVFDSVLLAKSAIKLTVKRQGDQWAKIYKVSRMQTVANPANNTDATGIMNQVLTEQFRLFFSDPSLLDFANKPS